MQIKQNMKALVVDSKIIDLFPHFEIERRIFSEAGIELDVQNVADQAEYIRLARDADALLLIGLKTPREVIRELKKCRVIVRYGAGYDVVDVDACTEMGIALCNIPDAGSYEVGSHAFALAMDCIRKLTFYDRQIRRGTWHAGSGYPVRRFPEYTFGYCGFGNIGRIASRLAAPLGCRRIAYDPFVDAKVLQTEGVTQVTFEELLTQADIISIHTPLNAKTLHLFDAEQFRAMKRGVIIINTSRGGLVNQEALMDAMDAGIVAAAGLDVNEHEPITDMNDRLLTYDTVILTPHTATESNVYAPTLQTKAAQTAVAVLRGELPMNTINRNELFRRMQK